MTESGTVGQRFTQLISHLGISKNAFAASLDKTATVIQHLVDERNKPGFDLLCRVFEVYPNVSKSWLMQGEGPMLTDEATASTQEVRPVPAVKATPATSVTAAQVPPPQPQDLKQEIIPPSATEVTAAPAPKITEASPAAKEPVPPVPTEPTPQTTVPNSVTATASVDASLQTALYTQQMAHQLALAELRNQHLQEQQRLMQQMLDLMQRQLVR